jgi:hypothetical protein
VLIRALVCNRRVTFIQRANLADRQAGGLRAQAGSSSVLIGEGGNREILFREANLKQPVLTVRRFVTETTIYHIAWLVSPDELLSRPNPA